MEWKDFLQEESKKEYYGEITKYLNKEYLWEQVYPPKEQYFAAFEKTPYEKVKIVILGQDPYHAKGQAMGLAFSVPDGVTIPPSLVNIFKEIESDLEIKCYHSGNLTRWAEQGVFLLNSTLSVRESIPNSHSHIGWQTLTDNAIKLLNERDNIVYLLWGKFARMKKDLITNPTSLVLEAPHPSPMSAHRGFFGCKHFSKANDFLDEHSIPAIDWR